MLKEQISQLFDSHTKNKIIQKNSTAEYRIKKLKLFKAYMIEHKEEIESALKSDFNKAGFETHLTEIIPIISMINLNIKNLKKWMRPKAIRGGFLFIGTKKYISYEAKGTCLVISPWNYPFQLAIYPVLTAFSAGNTVILKPSEFTPSTNKVIKKLIDLTFKPEEVFMVEGEVEVSGFLLDKPFDHIFFTGSTPVGKIVMEKASKNLSSVGLELGGKSPTIIDSRYDIQKAAQNIMWGKLVNAGQTCVAPDYILIEQKQLREFVKECKSSVKQMYPTIKNNPDYCSIINEKNFQRLKHLLDDAVTKGAQILLGGDTFDNLKFSPTLITNVNSEMLIMQEEIFGPILPIIVLDSPKHMKEFINQRDNPLVTYVYSYDQGFIHDIRSTTSSGGFSINETLLHVASPTLPFGGAGKSGIGRYHGIFGFEEMSNIRSVLHRKFETGTKHLYPPYTKNMKKLLDFVLENLNRLL